MQRFLSGPCGKLEAELWLPADLPDAGGRRDARDPGPATEFGSEPRAAAIVCHPHPRFGGTMDNTVVFRTARALRRAGCAILRFNFRGVGESEGVSEGSDVEIEDARAALDYLAREVPGVELWGAGFSFGARTVAALATTEPRIARVCLVAPPSKVVDCSILRDVTIPGLVVTAERDAFGNLADLRERIPDLPASLETTEVPETDHFFRHHTPELEARVHDYALRALETRT